MRKHLLFAAALLAALPASAAPPRSRTVDASELLTGAASLPVGAPFRLGGVESPDTAERFDLVLERFEVFASDAEIVVHGAGGERRVRPPQQAFFRGRVAGEDGSHAFLSVRGNGRAQGIVARAGEVFLVDEAARPAGAKAGGRLRMRLADAAALEKARGEGFVCGSTGQALQAPDPFAGLDLGAGPTGGQAEAPEPATAAATLYNVRVAIETDYEFLTKFNGNTGNATAYVGNLLGYVSTRYQAEIGTALMVQSLSLWTTASDPWSQTSTTCGLMEFGRYWNKNRGGVTRTIAHFLSGKSLGGGVAWLGVLCSGAFNVSTSCPNLPADAPWGGAYGFTASISGAFNPANPTVMWDVMAVAHEIGHNFNSPHTHCYNGIGGSASPVDGCTNAEAGNGCYAGSPGLPGPAGAGSGTIMSYCHLVRGSYSDIAWSFGTGHPYGTLPGRVPSRMTAHVQSRASTNPGCFAASLIRDGFENGLVPPWGGKYP